MKKLKAIRTLSTNGILYRDGDIFETSADDAHVLVTKKAAEYVDAKHKEVVPERETKEVIPEVENKVNHSRNVKRK